MTGYDIAKAEGTAADDGRDRGVSRSMGISVYAKFFVKKRESGDERRQSVNSEGFDDPRRKTTEAPIKIAYCLLLGAT